MQDPKPNHILCPHLMLQGPFLAELWVRTAAVGEMGSRGQGEARVEALTCLLGWDLSKPKTRLGFLLCRRRSAALKGIEKPWMLLQKSVVSQR